ncbi:MAG: hypothetical protein IJX92_06320 [Clostridia bacterium]|nr:hypothetical protein [Clostridia bacterium]
MKVFKSHSYDVVRLIINQIGISIFALVLYTSMGFIGENNAEIASMLQIAFSAFSVVFYYALIYNVVWEIGAKDSVQIENGKEALVYSKGIQLALYANIPNIVISLLATLTKVVYIFTGIEGLNTAFFLFNLFMRFILSMYIGVISAITAPFADLVDIYLLQSIAYVIIPLLSLLVCHAAYTLGRKNFRVFNKASN